MNSDQGADLVEGQSILREQWIHNFACARHAANGARLSVAWHGGKDSMTCAGSAGAVCCGELPEDRMSEEKIACPKCGSTLVTEIANMRKCNQCGAQFDVQVKPSPKVQRYDWSGFRPHQN